MDKIQFVDEIYKIPTSISEIGFPNYLKILNILSSKLNEDRKYILIINILTGIDIYYLEYIKKKDLYKLDIKFLFKGIKKQDPKDQYKINNTTYFLKEYKEDLEFGEYVDLEEIISKTKDLTEAVPKICSIILRDKKKNKTFKPYIPKLMTQLQKDLKEKLNTQDLYNIALDYLKYRDTIISTFKGLFVKEEKEEVEVEETNEENESVAERWGWAGVIFELAGHVLKVDEVTEKNHLLVLNYLANKKEKQDEINEAQKNDGNI